MESPVAYFDPCTAESMFV